MINDLIIPIVFVCVVIYLIIRLRDLESKLVEKTSDLLELKKKLDARPNSLELDEFLNDVASGGGILDVKRLNPGNLLIRHSRS